MHREGRKPARFRIIQNLWFWPYSFTMFIGNSFWGLPVKKHWQVNISHLCTQLSCPRDFLCCRVSPRQASLSLRRASRRAQAFCCPAKGPKTSDAPSGLIGADGRQPEEGGPTRLPLTQGPPADESVPPWGQTAGVRPWRD